MSLQPASMPLERFLPTADQPLTLEALLHGYGKWWQAQPSLTQYPRQYNTDREHFLIVWEGNPGFYDFYGDFAEDNTFYNYVIKGNMIHFHIRIVDRKTNSVEVRVFQKFELVYQHYYHTLADMRTGMIHEWVDITPDLGEGGEALRVFGERTLSLLQHHGENWVNAAPHTDRHFLVCQVDTYAYLFLWVGQSNAMTPANAASKWSAPIPGWSQLRLYSEIRVSVLRVPIRFEVYQRRWNGTPQNNNGYYVALSPPSYGTAQDKFEALQTRVEKVMKNLKFYTPAR